MTSRARVAFGWLLPGLPLLVAAVGCGESDGHTHEHEDAGTDGGADADADADVDGGVLAPTVTLTASPESISSGQSSTLTWSSTDATSCSSEGAWSGPRETFGSLTVAPTETSTYTLTCIGSGGQATGSATVTVEPGTIVTAAGCTVEEVQAAVSAAVSGDTVEVPEGTCQWNESVVVEAAIALVGAGIGATVIENTRDSRSGYALVHYVPTLDDASRIFELSGFTLDGGGIGGCFAASAPSPTTAITGLKIHDNRFTNGSSRAVILAGLELGVFYSNQFDTNDIAISVIGAGDAGWDYPHAFGTADYPYFEDNTFTGTYSGFVYETGQGGRIAFRRNTVTDDGCAGCEMLDLHGDQGDRGTVISETYRNTLTCANCFRWMHHRGGQAIIANNEVLSSDAFNITEYRAWGGNGVCGTYPQSDQIVNSFYWGNTADGAPQSPELTCGDAECSSCDPDDDTTFLHRDVEYFEPPSGVEANLSATCTPDSLFATTDTDRLFRCTAQDEWTPTFTPFPYPHPFR